MEIMVDWIAILMVVLLMTWVYNPLDFLIRVILGGV